MPSVLICSPAAPARERLARRAAGITGVRSVTTAAEGGEAVARFSVAPADLVLLDASLRDPDGVQTTRALLARRPGTEVVLVGIDEDPGLVARAMAAGARGFLRADPTREDLALALAHALAAREPAGRARGPVRPGETPASRTPVRGGPVRPVPLGTHGMAQRDAMAQRGGLVRGLGAPQSGTPGHPAHPGARSGAGQRMAGAPAGGGVLRGQLQGPTPGGPTEDASAAPRIVSPLSERELQVLNGMCEGKSNAEIGRDLFLSEDTVKTHARRLFRKLGVRDRAHAVAAGFRLGILS